MDKMLVIIVIFLAVVFSLAGILSMAAVPKIFQSAEKINQTQEIVNQSLIQQHEDQARANQTKHEDEAREKQAFQIIRENNVSLNTSLSNLEKRFYNFMNISAERAERGQNERQKLIHDNLLVFQNQDKLLIHMQNMTTEIYDLLKMAAERNYQATLKNTEVLANLTKELKEIKSLHKEIKAKLDGQQQLQH